MAPKIIFEDNSLLVLDKPPGLVVDYSETQKENTLENWLAGSYRPSASRMTLPRMGIVHRLDKDTSGIILVAKTPEVLEKLQEQFKNRAVKKEYSALVHGIISEAGRVEGSIGRNPKSREKFAVVSPGRWAVTEYEPLERLQVTGDRLQEIFPDYSKIQMRKLERQKYGDFTLIRCKPLTGRTHQIRVHLKYIGHPVVADQTYGGRKMYRLDHRWCFRQFLHAERIEFKHPISGKWMEFESKLPEDLETALKSLHE